MKFISSISVLALAGLLAASVVGCKKRPERVTKIPGSTPPMIGDTSGVPLDTTPISTGDNVFDADTGGVGASNLPFDQWPMSAEQPFQGDPMHTVYFDFDKSNVRPSEVPKIESVANTMKNYPGKALRVEGHCDERGTEEYNRALGERRALSVREYLVRLGMDPQMIDTISYGEDRPIDPGHNSAAWSKNRRGEFILLDPPK